MGLYQCSLVLLLGILVFVPFGTIAQESVSDQINRLRRDLEDIQNYLYRSTDLPPAKGGARSNGANPESNALLQRQVLELQTQMRDRTGQLEQVNHAMQVIGTRLDKLVADVDLRLRALETGGTAAMTQPAADRSAGAPSQTVVSRDAQGTTIISSRKVTGAPVPPGSNVLGSVRQRDVDAVRGGQTPKTAAVAPAPAQPFRAAPAPRPAPGPASVTTDGAPQPPRTASILPAGTVQEQYTFAFKLLQKRDYATAEAALREFVERHPDVPLAGNAMYWMGETYYVRKDYAEAARIFLDAYQRFPTGNKAADNLYKLAKSLAQIGENESACTTYGKMLKSFPTANARILSNARNDMSRLECS